MASDEDSDEDFVSYGTPLEPLEEDEPIRKPVPVHEQTVKDEKGRYKRFHGAFTGGFSAGYFNTVGTKEGWAPSTFLSTRQQKAERQNARPEDFMDEEDFGEHGIAPKEIVTTDDFASERKDQLKDKARAVSSIAALIPGDTGLLEELIAPARSSIGVELLRKMGWKDGQGVGPRLKRKQPKQNTGAVRVYGCVLPPNGSEESEEDDDEFAPENVTFAPKDVIPVDFTPKVDSHGLGYRGLNPLQALEGGSGSGHINLFTLHSDRATSLFGDKKKSGQQRRGGIGGQAFGVGAMEEEDSDIYHKDSMSNYDAVLGGEEPGDGLYGWTAPQQYTRKKNDSKRDVAYSGRILEGFTLASQAAEIKTVYPPPDLPRDYRPVHYFRPVVDPSSVSPIVAQALKASRGHLSQDAPEQGRHNLDSAQRRDVLGETPLEGPSSVFELLDSKDRDRLNEFRRAAEGRNKPAGDLSSAADRAAVVASAKAAALQALSSRFKSNAPQPDSHTQSMTAPIQPLASSETQMVLNAWSAPTADASKTFKPFSNNPQKQARYDLYINKLKQGNKDALDSSLDSFMTEWERGRERDEFVRAALLYKPSNSSLSSRFTRSKQEDDTDNVEVTRDQENDVDDKQAAVKMKMFGKLTRETFEWHPDKLLCKRFNIPNPYPGSSVVGMPKIKRDKYSVFNFLTITDSREAPSAPKTPSSSTTQKLTPEVSTKRSRWDVPVPGQASETKDPLSAFLSETRSEVSAAQQNETGVKTQTESPHASVTPEVKVALSDGQQIEQKTEEEEKEEDEEEVRPPMDLFKAIFASSSDEKSSSSSEDCSEEEDEVALPTSEPIQSGAGTVNPLISAPITPVPDISNVTDLKHLTVQSMPSAETAAQYTQSSDNAPAKSGLDEEEFGPRLPPPGFVPPARSPQLKKQKKKDKEKHRAKKHKKEKKKKKNKKHKHKGKQKKRVDESNSSSDDTDSNSEDENRVVSTSELLQRLKNIKNKR
ncbi:hypothetical protein R3I93_000542 [Phoxinus phoxinus]|uniref:G-patch domain-containing protein n=1 Tax=Phoxinus phoxinus TaxID=58324 RepID=A0AAN9DL96_9TELE